MSFKMNSSGKDHHKQKTNQNIQVYLRVRPTNSREKLIKSHEIVEVSSSREVVLKPNIITSLDSRSNKKFTFDKAFGTHSKQCEVYSSVVAPYIEEVLAGYNCTVFAYGQTGTGKTYTMVGEETPELSSSWEDDTQTGIIPRALNHLFDELRLTELEFSMRISYLELYNEELCDLLSTDDNIKIRIYDDTQKKGSIIVQGLEEIPVHSKDDVYKLLAKGQERRRTASTLMNAQSSRSHTIFSIIVHIKESGLDGEEMLKTGKLNLVDLAGSENITKAGNEKGIRTRESVNINQSLLTLGRVITALVEKTPHIPYRESKLTRLLQESLGGRTKTSIIATVSPGHKDFDETLSTLEYAHRAKNIQNKPEANQKLSKKTVIKEYTEEIDRLKRDLMASREKNGIYLAEDTYNDMLYKHEAQTKELNEKMMLVKTLKEDLSRKEALFREVSLNLIQREDAIRKNDKILTATKEELGITKKHLSKTKRRYTEKKVILDRHLHTEEMLTHQAKELMSVVHNVAQETEGLHETIERRREIETKNQTATEEFVEKMDNSVKEMINDVNNMKKNCSQFSNALISEWNKFFKSETESHRTTIKKIESLNHLSKSVMGETVKINEQFCDTHVPWTKEQLAIIKALFDDTNSYKEKLKNEFDKGVEIMKNEFVRQKSEFEAMFGSNIDHIVENFDTTSKFCQFLSGKLKEITTFKEEFEKHERNLAENLAKSSKAREDKKLELDKIEGEFKNFMDRMRKSLKTDEENEQIVEKTAESIGSTKRKLCSQLEECKKSVDDKFDNDQKASEVVKYEVEMTKRRRIEEDDSNIENLSKQKKIVDENCDLMSQNIEKIAENLQKYEQEVASRLSSIVESIKEHQTKSDKIVQEHCSILTDDLQQNIDEVADIQCIKTSMTGSQNRVIEEYGNMAAEKLHLTLEKVKKFKNEELQFYQPTGETPARKSITFPRDLAVTSPHDRIVRRFWRERGMMDVDTSITISEDNETVYDSLLDEEKPRIEIRNSTPLQSANILEDERKNYLKDLQISNIESRIVQEEEDKENMSVICESIES